MRLGGFSFFGGTAKFGGSIDAEERWYTLLQNNLGDGVYEKKETDVRSRFLMAMARMLAAMEAHAIKSSKESVPPKSIAALADWENVARLVFAPHGLKTIQRRQAFQRSLMRIMVNLCNIRKVEIEVRNMIEDQNCWGYENTAATMIGAQGVRYWAVLVPEYMQEKENRALYRAVLSMLQRWAPAHTVPALCTSSDLISVPGVLEFYSDGFRGCACGKDAPGQ